MQKFRAISPAHRLAFVCVSAAVALVWTASNTGSPRPDQAAPTMLTALPGKTGPAPAARAEIVKTYGQLPLSFEANQGQSDPQVKFLSRGQGYTLFLTSQEAVLSLHRDSAQPDPAALRAAAFEPGNRNSAVLRMKLIGADASAKLAGGDQQEGTTNYFIGNDPSQWRTNVPNYSNVRYRDAYPGIDLVYYGNQQQLEYDFVVSPGADPQAIRLSLTTQSTSASRSASPLKIAADGDLLVPTVHGEVRFHKPVVYQPDGSVRGHAAGAPSTTASAGNSVEGRWVLQGEHEVGFEIASYDTARPLVIDPALSYSTYIGGSNTDGAYGVAVDSSGNAYVAGFTNSPNFPTLNPYQASDAGGVDSFVLKLNPTGTAIVYSTYLGGSLTEYPFGIAVDSSGAAYVVGNTSSANFPVTSGAFQTTCRSCPAHPDVFLTKLSPAGNALAYSTFFGGSGDDRSFGITLDSSNDAYIVGWTSSSNLPVTAGSYQQTNKGGTSDAFVAEMNPSGSALVYSTYLGGSAQDVGFGIALDSAGDTFVTGYSYSLDFPVTPGAFQTSTTADGAAWVTELNPGATALVYSTYLGGTTGTSAGNSIKVDASGNAYVTGYTCASDFPITPGVFQPKFGGDCTPAGGDGFVSAVNPTGSALVFSSYLGGNRDDVGFSLGLDASNNVYITGRSSSTNYPTTPGAFQPANAGTYDCIFTIVSPDGKSLLYSTYFGGTAVDAAFVMAVDSTGNAYMIGRTYSTNFPVTPGAFQATQNGVTNAIVFKFSPGDQAWPLALNFGGEALNTTSTPLTATLTNSEPASLNINSIGITGTNPSDFAQTATTCGSSLAAGSSCTVTLTFTPSAAGARSAVLGFNDSSLNSPQNVALTGTGSSSSLTLTPASLTFATELIKTSSPSQPVALANNGASAVNLTNIATSGPYSQTSNCGSSLDIGANCTINVVFTPAKSGTQAGKLTVTDNAGNNPQTASLSGVGTAVALSPTSLSFGNQKVKTSSFPQSVFLTNVGTSAITLTKISITGPRATSYSQMSNCPIAPATLAGGANCNINVTFTPLFKGALNANLTITDTGGGSPQNVALSGTGN